mmetsp:Transcript_56215/g.101033  ORF Transcript_56215/g.101033 Transcript_56215/m.101033 type:complete len:106 (+) Transcript_56215:636-953(+)
MLPARLLSGVQQSDNITGGEEQNSVMQGGRRLCLLVGLSESSPTPLPPLVGLPGKSLDSGVLLASLLTGVGAAKFGPARQHVDRAACGSNSTGNAASVSCRECGL